MDRRNPVLPRCSKGYCCSPTDSLAVISLAAPCSICRSGVEVARKVYMTYKYIEYRKNVHALLGSVCIRCGTEQNLELHHRDEATKRFNPSRFYSAKLSDEVIQEILKCDLLCETCHKTKHQTKHGKRAMYNRGCRCDMCREAVRREKRDYRARIQGHVAQK